MSLSSGAANTRVAGTSAGAGSLKTSPNWRVRLWCALRAWKQLSCSSVRRAVGVAVLVNVDKRAGSTRISNLSCQDWQSKSPKRSLPQLEPDGARILVELHQEDSFDTASVGG